MSPSAPRGSSTSRAPSTSARPPPPSMRPLASSRKLTTIALLFLLTAIFLPLFNTPRTTYNYLIIFDITQSMNVEDYDLNNTPMSRLTFARAAVRRALGELPCGSKVGWGIFAEYRTLVLLAPIEVCENYNDLLASLDRIDGRMRWGNASEISKGVFWALRGARDIGGHPRVLFLTDGQEAPPVEGAGLPMFDDIKRGDITGSLIGIGGYAPRPIPRTDADGRPMGFWHADEVVQRDTSTGATPSHEHLSEVREPYLKQLAHQAGLEYQHLDNFDSIRAAMLRPSFAEKRPAPTDFASLAAAAALVALVAEFCSALPWRLSYRIRTDSSG